MSYLEACTRKERFESKKDARREIVRRGRKWARSAKVYRCVICDKYHIGHKTKAYDRLGERGTR